MVLNVHYRSLFRDVPNTLMFGLHVYLNIVAKCVDPEFALVAGMRMLSIELREHSRWVYDCV